MKSKFLVLGIGAAQADLLEKISGLFELHAVSNSHFGLGRKYADYFSLIDIVDKQAVLDYAKKNKIDYIYSVGSDIAMPTVTYVAERLGLRSFVSYKTALVCNNKMELRHSLQNAYGSVDFEIISKPNQATSLALPAIIKPVDSQGQRGVQTIADQKDIPEAFGVAVGYSRCGLAILEEKIVGQEISVNAYLVDGKIKFFLPSDRESWDEFDGGIIRKHVLPTKITDSAIRNVYRLVEETVGILGIKNGPIYYQIIVRDELPYLIEVTPRLDGCHMWRLIEIATGVDLLKQTILHLSTGVVSFPENFSVNNSVLEFFCQPPDTQFIEPTSGSNACFTERYYQPGENVKRMNGKMEKCGYEIVESFKEQ